MRKVIIGLRSVG